MRDTAIRNTHPTVVTINAETEAWDKDGNVVELDEGKVETELSRLEEVWNSQAYARERAEQYPDLKEQLDLIWHAIDNDELTKSVNNKFYTMLKKVKDDNPKG